MIIFGLIGYFMRKTGFATSPVVLGIILGPMAESGFRRSLVLGGNNILLYYLSRPLCLALIALIILSLMSPIIMEKLRSKGINVPDDEFAN